MRFVLIHDMSPGVSSRECWLDLDRVVAIRKAFRQSGADENTLIDISILETDGGRTYVVDMIVEDAIEMVEKRGKH